MKKFKTIYNYKQSDGVKFTTPSLTQQQFAEECDINNIMDKYLRTGVLSDPLAQSKPGSYGDFTELGDYMAHMNAIVEANERFEALPAKVRDRFQNNPAKMIEFVNDRDNMDEAIKLGLIDKKEKEIMKKKVISEKEISPSTGESNA